MSNKLRIIILLSLLFVFIGNASASSPVLSNSGDGSWDYYKEITIHENSGSTLIDFQVLVELSGSDFPTNAKMDGGDVRFIDENGNELDYWIESWDYSNKNAKIWLKISQIPASGNEKLTMYYGNQAATSISNGDSIFVFFDDFNDGVYSDKWDSKINRGSITETDGYLQLAHDGYYCGLGEKVYTKNPLFSTPSSVTIEFGVKAYNDAIWGGAVRTSIVDSIDPNLENYGPQKPKIGFFLEDCSSSCGGTSYNYVASASSYTENVKESTWTKNELYDLKINIIVNDLDIDDSKIQFHRLGYVEEFTGYPTSELFPFYIELSQGSCSVDFTGSYDYIRVRKFTSIEPSLSIGSEMVSAIQKNYPTETITIPTTATNPTTTSTPTTTQYSSRKDSDGDGWSDEKEELIGTNPYSVDSDNDGINDPQDPNPNVPENRIPGFGMILTMFMLLTVVYLNGKYNK